MRTLSAVLLPVATAFCLLAPSAGAFAQAAPAPSAQTQNAKKGKTVKFTLKNATSTPMDLKSGDEPLTLAAGQSRSMKVAPGTKIVKASTTEPETLVTEITDDMSGVTVNVR
jgi:hypothetical protein